MPLKDSSPLDINLLDEDIFQVDVDEKFTPEEFDMMMYFDGFKCEKGGGISVSLFIPQGVHIPYSFKLAFSCMNNNVEYEALILGLRIAKDLKVDRLIIYGDSLLIMNQILDIYHCHNKLLKSYKKLVVNLFKHFKIFKIKSTLRSSNHFTDTMASLGSLILPNLHQYI